jgi:hypothetical protein
MGLIIRERQQKQAVVYGLESWFWDQNHLISSPINNHKIWYRV